MMGTGASANPLQEAGLEYLSHEGVAPLFLDYDNDGDQDLFVSAVGPQILLQNRLKEEGELSFADVSLESGVAVPAIGFSAVAGDVNGDGLPEIYVASYNRYGMVMPNSWGPSHERYAKSPVCQSGRWPLQRDGQRAWGSRLAVELRRSVCGFRRRWRSGSLHRE